MKQGWVYILTNRCNGTLYIGVTSELVRRTAQHKSSEIDGFTKKYGVNLLVYYEAHESMETAILREKQLKKWERKWKLRLIEEQNPQWRDLWPDITGFPPSRE